MSIDWAAFTPYSALIGGALIGLASVLLILGIGRVAGISGIVGVFFSRPISIAVAISIVCGFSCSTNHL